MDVEIVVEHLPRRGQRRDVNKYTKGETILASVQIAGRAADRAGEDIEHSNQHCPVKAYILELAVFRVARFSRQASGRAFQCLEASHIIDPDDARYVRQRSDCILRRANIGALSVAVRTRRCWLPVTVARLLEVGLLFTNCLTEPCGMPSKIARAIDCRTSSLSVRWRSEISIFSGSVEASALIRQITSSVSLVGAPVWHTCPKRAVSRQHLSAGRLRRG